MALALLGLTCVSSDLSAQPGVAPQRAPAAKAPAASQPVGTAQAVVGPSVASDGTLRVVAPVSAVTVYSDSARVARSARLTLSGPLSRLRFPPLCGQVDPSSLRVDVQGHSSSVEVARIEIETPLLGDLKSAAERLPITEVKRLISTIEAIDDELARLAEEDAALRKHQDLLSQLSPTVPPLPQTGGKGSPLNPTGWGAGLAFLRSRQETLHRRSHDIEERRFQLAQGRQQIADSLQAAQGEPGWTTPRRCLQVTATLRGQGLTDAWLSYRTRGARWEPTYDIQLLPERGRVELQFAAQVSQSSGEDWDGVLLSLSTAVPTRATQLPKLVTWKLGARERFVPTPSPVSAPPSPPPPSVPILTTRSIDAGLRQRLLSLLSRSLPMGRTQPTPDAAMLDRRAQVSPPMERDADGIVDQPDTDDNLPAKDRAEQEESAAKPEAPPPPPPPPPPASMPASGEVERVVALAKRAPAKERRPVLTEKSLQIDLADDEIGGSLAKPQVQVLGVGLSPPPGYVPPSLDPRSAAARAGGFDLSYASLHRESLGSGKGARRVALFSRSFPVRALRKIYPAMTRDAYLVALIQNPTSGEGGQPLPGGSARLFVGADPAGHAELGLVAPGERFTLPLGIDRALKPVRNVQLSTEEKGVFSKDEITQYEVVTELANPYPLPIDVQLIDQLPLPGDKNVELRLLSISPPPAPLSSPPTRAAVPGFPYADSPHASAIDPETGAVEWRLSVPAGGKIETRFRYTLRRPKGARLYQ